MIVNKISHILLGKIKLKYELRCNAFDEIANKLLAVKFEWLIVLVTIDIDATLYEIKYRETII